jgi:voltage-gated potassium channel
LFEIIGTIIWVVFILNFTAEFVLAPHKVTYLRRNWLTAISLLIPALRIFRVFRVFRLLQLTRAGRGCLLRVVSSLNRGMHALGASLSRRGFGYMIALTVLVTFAGAAGIVRLRERGSRRPDELRRGAVVDRNGHDDDGGAGIVPRCTVARARCDP